MRALAIATTLCCALVAPTLAHDRGGRHHERHDHHEWKHSEKPKTPAPTPSIISKPVPTPTATPTPAPSPVASPAPVKLEPEPISTPPVRSEPSDLEGDGGRFCRALYNSGWNFWPCNLFN